MTVQAVVQRAVVVSIPALLSTMLLVGVLRMLRPESGLGKVRGTARSD